MKKFFLPGEQIELQEESFSGKNILDGKASVFGTIEHIEKLVILKGTEVFKDLKVGDNVVGVIKQKKYKKILVSLNFGHQNKFSEPNCFFQTNYDDKSDENIEIGDFILGEVIKLNPITLNKKQGIRKYGIVRFLRYFDVKKLNKNHFKNEKIEIFFGMNNVCWISSSEKTIEFLKFLEDNYEGKDKTLDDEKVWEAIK